MFNLSWDFLYGMTSRLGGVWKEFVYTSGLVAMDTGSNIKKDVTVQLQDNKGFIWAAGLYSTDTSSVEAGSDILYGGLLIKFDEATGYGQLSKNSVMVESIFGRGGLSGGPRPLVQPLYLGEGNTQFGFNLENLTGVSVNVRLDFIGLKRY